VVRGGVLAKELAEAVRRVGRFRWVGLYDVGEREVAVQGWRGPARRCIHASLGGRADRAAISGLAPVVVQDVLADARHLPTLEGTRA
jgi:putative methionine-R-sulfoxide reductase with GAF domain